MENFEKEEKKGRQVDNLINLVENHTRTKRHLEQYSHIGNPENRENAREKQEVRNEQIRHLKQQLTMENDIRTKEEQLKDLKEKYESVQSYIDNNSETMNKEQLRNVEEKQENRKMQIENLE